MAVLKLTQNELNDFVSKYSLYKVIFPKDLIDEVINLKEVPKNYNELMSPLNLPKDFKDETSNSFRNPRDKINDTIDKAYTNFSSVNFRFSFSKIREEDPVRKPNESVVLGMGDLYQLYESTFLNEDGDSSAGTVDSSVNDSSVSPSAEPSKESKVNYTDYYVSTDDILGSPSDASYIKSVENNQKVSKGTNIDVITTRIDNYLDSVILNVKQLMQSTIGATSEELTSIDNVVNKARQTTSSSIKDYIKNNNEVIKEFKESYTKKENNLLRKERDYEAIKVRVCEYLLKGDREKAKKELSKLKGSSDYYDFAKSMGLLGENLNYIGLKQLFEDAELNSVPLYDGTETFNEIYGIIRGPFQRVFNKDPKEWNLIKQMNDRGKELIEGCTNEIAKAIEIRCNQVINVSGDANKVTVGSQKANYGHGIPSIGNDRISIRRGIPFQATGLVNLWNRYAQELNNRLDKRIHEVMTCPSLQWLREFCTSSVPRLIALMVVFRQLTYLFRDMNASVLINKQDIIKEMSENSDHYLKRFIDEITIKVNEILTKNKRYGSIILKNLFEKLNRTSDLGFYIEMSEKFIKNDGLTSEDVEKLLNGK